MLIKKKRYDTSAEALVLALTNMEACWRWVGHRYVTGVVAVLERRPSPVDVHAWLKR